MLTHFYEKRPSDKVSVTIGKKSVFFLHKICRFYLHYNVLCLTNVNINVPPTQF